MAPQRMNLLLCFDAFGTLFKPKLPIEKQYGDVARSFGLHGFNDEDVKDSLRAAMKHESKENPNYGKAKGLNPEIWWTNVIHNTFKPLIGDTQSIPTNLIKTLFQRFWCDGGYSIFSDVQPLLHGLREAHKANNSRIVVGVITNSDDRVPDILTSLGMRINSLRYGETPRQKSHSASPYDIDFTVMSYDVGHEKPDKRIFAAAEELLQTQLEADASVTAEDMQQNRWQKVYVGDEYDKDVVGAFDAGWNAVLIDRDHAGERRDITWLDDRPRSSLSEVLGSSKGVGFSSLAKLADWLP